LLAEAVAFQHVFIGGYNTGTWQCQDPQNPGNPVSLSAGDAIKVVLIIRTHDLYQEESEVPDGYAEAIFITEQLADATQLDYAQWTFHYYAEFSGGESLTLRFDTPTYDTRIANFSYSASAPGQGISPTGVDSTSVVGDSSILPGAIGVSPTGVDPTSTVENSSIETGPVGINPEGIGSTEVVDEPQVQQDALNIQPTGVDSTEVVGDTGIEPGVVTVNPEGVDSTEVVGDSVVEGGLFEINPEGVGSSEVVDQPVVAMPQLEDFTGPDYSGWDHHLGGVDHYDMKDYFEATTNTQTWQPNTQYALTTPDIFLYAGDTVYPVTPIYGTFGGDQLPLYFRVVTGGTSGDYGQGNEPNWNTDIYGITTDGTVEWRTYPIFDFITVTQHKIEWHGMRPGTSGGENSYGDWALPQGPMARAGVVTMVDNVMGIPYFTHKFETNVSYFDGCDYPDGFPYWTQRIEFGGYNGTQVYGIIDEEYNEGWADKYRYNLELRQNPHTRSGNVFCVLQVEYVGDPEQIYSEIYHASVIPLNIDQTYYWKVTHTNEAPYGKLRFEAYSDAARTTLIDDIVIDLPSDFDLISGGWGVWNITMKIPDKKSSGWFANLDYGLPPSTQITPTGVESTEVVGSAGLTTGPVTISPDTTASTEVVGDAGVEYGPFTVSPEGVETTEVVGEAGLEAGPVEVNPETTDSTSTVGDPLLSGAQSIETEGVESTSVVPEPSVQTGPTSEIPFIVIEAKPFIEIEIEVMEDL